VSEVAELERETRDWLAWADQWAGVPAISDPAALLSRWLDHADALARENAELRADRERLDWLGAQIVEVNRQVFADGLRYARGDTTSDDENALLIRRILDSARSKP